MVILFWMLCSNKCYILIKFNISKKIIDNENNG